MSEVNRLDNENFIDYCDRLISGKESGIYDLDKSELWELMLGEKLSSDEARKQIQGLKKGIRKVKEEMYGDGIGSRILSISDTHVPFQVPKETFSDFVGRVDILNLNGDILDCQSISKFVKTYRVSMMEEMIQSRQYMIDLINYVKPKKVIINYGNHELRFQNYLSKNIDNDMLELMPQTALDLICTDGFNHYDKRNKIKTWYEPIVNVFDDILVEYTENWWCKIGKSIFCHPCVYKSGMMQTAEKAMNYFLTVDREFDTIVMSHTHQLGNYTKGMINLYEQGACCQLEKINYADGQLHNPQHKGFAYICQDKDGNLIKDKTKLIHINN